MQPMMASKLGAVVAGDGLAKCALNGKLDRNGLIAVRKAGALIGKHNDAIVSCILRSHCERLTAHRTAGFDPQNCRVDDVENHGSA